MKTEIVEVTYKYKITYQHDNHLQEMIRDLKKDPIFEVHGAGIVDGKVYHYSCDKIGKGKVNENTNNMP